MLACPVDHPQLLLPKYSLSVSLFHISWAVASRVPVGKSCLKLACLRPRHSLLPFLASCIPLNPRDQHSRCSSCKVFGASCSWCFSPSNPLSNLVAFSSCLSLPLPLVPLLPLRPRTDFEVIDKGTRQTPPRAPGPRKANARPTPRTISNPLFPITAMTSSSCNSHRGLTQEIGSHPLKRSFSGGGPTIPSPGNVPSTAASVYSSSASTTCPVDEEEASTSKKMSRHVPDMRGSFCIDMPSAPLALPKEIAMLPEGEGKQMARRPDVESS